MPYSLLITSIGTEESQTFSLSKVLILIDQAYQPLPGPRDASKSDGNPSNYVRYRRCLPQQLI
jgi:hypothetical protein